MLYLFMFVEYICLFIARKEMRFLETISELILNKK